jgi:hypothetical protein
MSSISSTVDPTIHSQASASPYSFPSNDGSWRGLPGHFLNPLPPLHLLSHISPGLFLLQPFESLMWVSSVSQSPKTISPLQPAKDALLAQAISGSSETSSWTSGCSYGSVSKHWYGFQQFKVISWNNQSLPQSACLENSKLPAEWTTCSGQHLPLWQAEPKSIKCWLANPDGLHREQCPLPNLLEILYFLLASESLLCSNLFPH